MSMAVAICVEAKASVEHSASAPARERPTKVSARLAG